MGCRCMVVVWFKTVGKMVVSSVVGGYVVILRVARVVIGMDHISELVVKVAN